MEARNFSNDFDSLVTMKYMPIMMWEDADTILCMNIKCNLLPMFHLQNIVLQRSWESNNYNNKCLKHVQASNS